jgi:hypothetical protein
MKEVSLSHSEIDEGVEINEGVEIDEDVKIDESSIQNIQPINYIKKNKCNTIKRCCLIVTIFPFLPLIHIREFEWCREVYYSIFTISISTYVILINFPIIVKQFHSRPIYYDDLEDTKFINVSIRKRFQFIFIFILQITLTLIVAGLVYYYHDRLNHTNLSNMEVFGVLGGFISLLLKIENIVGKISLTVINIIKSRDLSQFDEDDKRPRSNSLEYITSG